METKTIDYIYFMKKKILFFLILSLISCRKENDKTTFKNYQEFWAYYNKNIVLSSEFIALDENSAKISKEDFLKKLISGKYAPIRPNKNALAYQLQKLDAKDSDISSVVSGVASTEFKNYKMVDTDFPKFNFVDLNGNVFNSDNTKNKTIILKTWYTQCQVCNEESPELNKLTESYGNDKNFLFISLALNNKEELEKFTKERNIKYAVVPNQNDFIQKTLRVEIFPTYLVVKNNKILKVYNSIKELRDYLQK